VDIKYCETCGGKWDADTGEHICVSMPEPKVEEPKRRKSKKRGK